MRTTVDIPNAMYRRLKVQAVRQGTSAKALILASVAQVLDGRETSPRRRVTLPLVASKRPGSLALDNARIYEVISFP